MSDYSASDSQSDYQALSETSLLLTASLDLQFVLDNLLLILMGKLLVSRGAFLLYDPVARSYRLVAIKGTRELQPGATFSEEELAHGLPSPLVKAGFHYHYPVIYQERRLGILLLGKKATGTPLNSRDQDFIHTFLNFASVAIHSALLVEELRQANRELDARIQALNTLFELSKEFNRTLDRDRVLRLLAYALMGQLVVRRFIFLLRREGSDGPCNGGHLEVVAARNLPDVRLSPELEQRLCALRDIHLVEEKDPLWRPLAHAGLQLIIPLELQGVTQGVLGLGPKLTGEPFAPEEVEFVYALGTLALISIQNTYLIEERLEKERLEEELRLARSIQERLLPRRIPTLPGLEVAARAIASREVAGDYYDVLCLDDHRLLLAIADVSGKGVPAALLMASLQASLRVTVDCEEHLAAATRRLNRVMYENTDMSHFVTFCWGIWEHTRHRFRYVNAGHNPPLLFRRTGRVERLRKGGLLLGAFPEGAYEEGRVRIQPGELLVFFTDGVTEAYHPERGEFGEHRLVQWIKRHRDLSADGIVSGLVEEVRRFTDKRELDDDLTLLVVKRVT